MVDGAFPECIPALRELWAACIAIAQLLLHLPRSQTCEEPAHHAPGRAVCMFVHTGPSLPRALLESVGSLCSLHGSMAQGLTRSHSWKIHHMRWPGSGAKEAAFLTILHRFYGWAWEIVQWEGRLLCTGSFGFNPEHPI